MFLPFVVFPWGSIAVVATLVLLAVLIVIASAGSAIVTVSDEVTVPQDQDTVERLAFGALGSIPGVTMTQMFPGQLGLASKWLPGWALLVGLLTLPLGLLVLFLVRSEAILYIRFLSDGDTTTTVQVAGRARKRVALRVGDIFDTMAVEGVPR